MGEKCNVLKLQYIIIKERKMQFFQIMLMYSHLPNTSFELGGKLKTFSFCYDLAFFFPLQWSPFSPLQDYGSAVKSHLSFKQPHTEHQLQFS